MNALKLFRILIVAAVAVAAGTNAHARVKLVSLPQRGDVVVRLDNPQGTLVEEERILALQQGINRVDFSWNGVEIDPDSIRLTLLSHPDRATLLNVSYPPDESALVWEISSEEAWEEKVRVSYLLNGIDSLLAYKAVANKDENKFDFTGRLVLRNFSGEDFEKARILLNFGDSFEKEIAHEQTSRLFLFSTSDAPVEKVWTFDAGILPWDSKRLSENVGIPVSYRFKNVAESGLGQFALPGGKVRVFQDDGSGSTIFLGEDAVEYVPVGQKAEIRIGDSRDIVVTQQKLREKKINVRRNEDNQVVLYDTDEIVNAKIENFKQQPAVLTMFQHIPGQWDMAECSFEYKLKDASTLEFEIRLAPGEKKELNMHYHRRNVR